MFSHEETAAGSACREQWHANNQLSNYRSKVRKIERQLEGKGAASGRSGGTRDQWQPAAEDQSAAAADVEMREPPEAAEVVEPKAMPRQVKKPWKGSVAAEQPQAQWKEARAGKKDPEHAEDSDSSSCYKKGSVAAYWQQEGRKDKIVRKAKEDLKKFPPPWRGPGSVASTATSWAEQQQQRRS